MHSSKVGSARQFFDPGSSYQFPSSSDPLPEAGVVAKAGSCRPYRWWRSRACVPENAVHGKRRFSFESRVRAALVDEAWEQAGFVERAAEELARQNRAAARAGIVVAAKERRVSERRVLVEQRRLFEARRAEDARVRVREHAERF